MGRKTKKVGLILGLLLVIFSFLFFGRNVDTFEFVLISGLLSSLVFYVMIVSGNDSVKAKIGWTLIVIFSALTQNLTEPILIKSSYLIYLNSSRNELDRVNVVLSDKPGDVFITDDTIIERNNVLTVNDRKDLFELRRKLDIPLIYKTDNKISYALWGFLDNQLAITYCIRNKPTGSNLEPLSGKWYY